LKIQCLNSVWCKADIEATKIIAPHLEYEYKLWKKGPFGMSSKATKSYFINRTTGVFLAGLLPRVMQLGKFTLVSDKHKNVFSGFAEPVKNPNFELYNYQYDLMLKIFSEGRGVISALTSAGKTIIAASAITTVSTYYYKTLFLCHTKELLNQTYDEFTKFGIRCSKVGDGFKLNIADVENSDVVISTIQSLVKSNPEDYKYRFSLVIVDETHHVNDIKSRYGKVLTQLECWNRIGLTATVPKEKAKLFALEGLIGPVIGEYTLKEGVENKNAVKPRITLLPVERKSSTADLKKYMDIYKEAISGNEDRNTSIIEACRERNKAGKTVLVMIREIDHGNNLLNIAKETKLGRCIFIQGKNKSDIKKSVKDAFQNKSIMTVIVTDIWSEGINIPSLNCVVNAAAGKSERATLQKVGRGLRNSEGKTELEIIDFLDPYKYLAEHAMARFNIYANEGWL